MDKITIYLLEEKQAKRKGGLYLEMVSRTIDHVP